MNKKIQNELLKIVEKNYREIAEEYNSSRKKHLAPLWNNLIKLAKTVKPGEKVLDVGCGNGRLLEAFLGKDIEYVGLDQNSKLLELAKKNYPENDFVLGDILDLGKFPQYDFDHVFLIAVLHHLPGADLRVQALRQIRNKIKSDGRIVITVWNMWGQKKFRRAIWKFFLLKLIGKNKMDFGDIVFSGFRQGSERYYHAFRKREIKRIAKKAGLKPARIFKDNYNYYAVLYGRRAG